MTISEIPDTLSAERLMAVVQQLSVVIGPRPPASRAEREAAAYIHNQIRALDSQWDLINQPFRSIDGFRYRLAPLALVAGLNLLLGLNKNRQTQIITGATSVGLSMMSRDAFLARPAVWEHWLPRGESQNVIVRIPPRGKIERRVVFMAHLDSGIHRITTDPRIVRQLPRTLGGITLMALIGGVLTMLSGKNQRWRALRTLLAGSALGGAALAIMDEMGPDVNGAIGNASGVATLLGLATALHQHPLQSTEVVLAFTGSATAISTGADVFAAEYAKGWCNALWVVVANVGVGELCWLTRHGISPYAHYHPHPDAVQIMERVADARPDLGMMGKEMVIIDEISILRDRDLRAVGLMAYDRATGLIPHWRQNSDTIHAVDPATIERAAQACWTTAQIMDQAAQGHFTWPPAK
ncbi:MAG: hypothetical protein JXA10_19920 [Anaerolineae bacterium]|nr:hypothetical protein [Anaerolineae bacterium]